MKNLVYPVIITEMNDDGHYYVVTSPNISGMITQGDTFSEAAYWAEDAIATMIDGEDEYPEVQDPKDWDLKDNDRLVYISVDMNEWTKRNSKTVRRTITIPEYLNNIVKKSNLNVSRIATEAIKEELGI